LNGSALLAKRIFAMGQFFSQANLFPVKKYRLAILFLYIYSQLIFFGLVVWFLCLDFVYSANYRILPQQPIFWVKNYLLARMRKIAAGLFMGQ